MFLNVSLTCVDVSLQPSERAPDWMGQSLSGGLPGDPHHSIVLDQGPRPASSTMKTQHTRSQTVSFNFFHMVERIKNMFRWSVNLLAKLLAQLHERNNVSLLVALLTTSRVKYLKICWSHDIFFFPDIHGSWMMSPDDLRFP